MNQDQMFEKVAGELNISPNELIERFKEMMMNAQKTSTNNVQIEEVDENSYESPHDHKHETEHNHDASDEPEDGIDWLSLYLIFKNSHVESLKKEFEEKFPNSKIELKPGESPSEDVIKKVIDIWCWIVEKTPDHKSLYKQGIKDTGHLNNLSLMKVITAQKNSFIDLLVKSNLMIQALPYLYEKYGKEMMYAFVLERLKHMLKTFDIGLCLAFCDLYLYYINEIQLLEKVEIKYGFINRHTPYERPKGYEPHTWLVSPFGKLIETCEEYHDMFLMHYSLEKHGNPLKDDGKELDFNDLYESMKLHKENLQKFRNGYPEKYKKIMNLIRIDASVIKNIMSKIDNERTD